MSMSIDFSDTSANRELLRTFSERLAVRRMPILVCLWFAAFFLYVSYLPLFYTDVWGHVAYGQWIIENGTLPGEDPFLNLAAGVDVIDTAWLGQVILGAVESWGGIAWISNLYALVLLLTYCAYAGAFQVQQRRTGLSLIGATLVLAIASSRFAIVRTEIFGTLCFATLLLIVALAERAFADGRTGSAAKRVWPLGLAVFPIFLFWANSHGSFVVGLTVTACLFAGRFLEVAWCSRSLRAIAADREVRFWLVATELAVAASLINPYGMDLFVNTLTFSANPNLPDVLEWFPLGFGMLEGLVMCASWVMIAGLLRWSDRRIRPAELLLIVVFSVLTIQTVRMIGWYAGVFGYCVLPHLTSVTARVSRSWAGRHVHDDTKLVRASARSIANTAICAMIVWCGFSISPISSSLLGGARREPERILNKETPRELTEFLRRFQPQGQVWNPQWWGDWLQWQGPEGMQLFVTTNAVHLTPHRVWKDYMRVAQTKAGWETVLKRYNITTMVIHKRKEVSLDSEARILPGWRIVYEDELGLVVTREPRRPFEEHDKTPPIDRPLAKASASPDSLNHRPLVRVRLQPTRQPTPTVQAATTQPP